YLPTGSRSYQGRPPQILFWVLRLLLPQIFSLYLRFPQTFALWPIPPLWLFPKGFHFLPLPFLPPFRQYRWFSPTPYRWLPPLFLPPYPLLQMFFPRHADLSKLSYLPIYPMCFVPPAENFLLLSSACYYR